jgi:hypothetical protein
MLLLLIAVFFCLVGIMANWVDHEMDATQRRKARRK